MVCLALLQVTYRMTSTISLYPLTQLGLLGILLIIRDRLGLVILIATTRRVYIEALTLGSSILIFQFILLWLLCFIQKLTIRIRDSLFFFFISWLNLLRGLLTLNFLTRILTVSLLLQRAIVGSRIQTGLLLCIRNIFLQ